MSDKEITPVFIIGASRNGTTSLENLISCFPKVTAIEHELHHGSHEAKLYGFYKYYEDLSDPDDYIDFIHHYASEDYFNLAEGNISYHLKKHSSNFFDFFCNLMDSYCLKNNKKFWTAKLDTAFFTDPKTLGVLLDILNAKYTDIKFIRIKRDFNDALLSAQYMEGKEFNKQKRWPYRYYHLLAYTQSWFKAYEMDCPLIPNESILEISFNEFIKDEPIIKSKIKSYLKIEIDSDNNINRDKFAVNTSFHKQNRPQELSFIDKWLANSYLNVLKRMPGVSFFFRTLNHFLFFNNPPNPIYRKIIKSRYFKDHLKKKFKNEGAESLISHIND